MRNSTFLPEYRKLPGDARQQRGYWELTFERLPEIDAAAGYRTDLYAAR